MKGMVINMKKTIIAAFLTLTLLLSFTACADNKEGTQKETDSTGAPQPSQLEKTDLTLGYLNSTAHLLAFVARTGWELKS